MAFDSFDRTPLIGRGDLRLRNPRRSAGSLAGVVQARLPAAHRDALRLSLEVGDPAEIDDQSAASAANPQRVAMAVLAACRALASQGPLLIAVDDASWTE